MQRQQQGGCSSNTSSSGRQSQQGSEQNLLSSGPCLPALTALHIPHKPLQGAALAHLCAMDLRVIHDPEDLRVVTFGSPRVGNAVFSSFFEEHVAEAWRYTHGRDIVPSVPPTLMGEFICLAAFTAALQPLLLLSFKDRRTPTHAPFIPLPSRRLPPHQPRGVARRRHPLQKGVTRRRRPR